MRSLIQRIEEKSMNAWPALQTNLYDGWILRFAEGYTKRSNSINPIYPSSIDLQKKIINCEKLYQSKNRSVIFKLTQECFPSNLDLELEKRGYVKNSPTTVQILSLNNFDSFLDKNIIFSADSNQEWINSFKKFSHLGVRQKDTLQRMLENITYQPCYVMMRLHGNIIACGLGVLSGQHIGLFEIVVSEAHRGRGIGKKLLYGILTWAKDQDAKTAYLQVIKGNIPAEQLYAKIGFKAAYTYWYRIKH